MKTKRWIIALTTIVFLNLLFLGSKHYSVESREIQHFSESEYKSVLKSLKPLQKIEFISDTKIDYFFIFPENSIYIFYFFYFLVAIGYIINRKV